MLRPARGLLLLALLLLLRRSTSAVHNDATESGHTQLAPDTQDEPADEDTNQANNGGRRQTGAARNGESKVSHDADTVQLHHVARCDPR